MSFSSFPTGWEDWFDGTPSTTALELKYVSNEALIMILQLLGSDPFVRPSVNQGILNRSVQQCFRLGVFSEDLAVPDEEDLLQEYRALSSYLTGNPQSGNVVFIDAPDAVHDMYIANPNSGLRDRCHRLKVLGSS